MSLFSWAGLSKKVRKHSPAEQRRQRRKRKDLRGGLLVERLEERTVLSALAGTPSSNETVTPGFTADELAAALVGSGVTIENATYTGSPLQNGGFTFADAKVVGFGQGIILSSGNAADVVGPNTADYTSSTFPPLNSQEPWGPGDSDLDNLSGFPTYDAAVLEFDFWPTANQVVFQYAFASDEYPEWVNTPFNDVFAFYVNGTNHATVRQDILNPNSPFVPVAVNNINQGNPEFYPEFVPQRPDLFRPNYFNPNGPSVIDLEQDGITTVLTFQAPVNPGAKNHMKLAIADASDGIYDSAVFIQAGSLVSNENPVADLSLIAGQAPLTVTAFVEGEDPNNKALTYTIDWGDKTAFTTGALVNETALENHTYATPGEYLVTLTVSNGTLQGTSTEDVHVSGTGSEVLDTFIVSQPSDPSDDLTPSFTFGSTQAVSTFEYSLDGWQSFTSVASSNVTLPTLELGVYTIEVRAVNGGVVDDSPAQYTWEIVGNAVAPETVIETMPSDPSNNTAPTFTFSSSDPEAGFEYKLDPLDPLNVTDWKECEDALTLSTLSDGEHTIVVRALDESDNADPTPAIYTWTVDTRAPVATITQWPAELSNDNTPTFTFIADEEDVIFTYSIDGGAFVPGKSGIPLFPALADGPHTFAVRAIDAADNVGDSVSYSWVIDATQPAAPDVALASDSGSSAVDGITNDGTLKVTAEPGAKIEYSVDGGVTWTADFAAQEGENKVQVRQTDLAGNTSGAAALSFTRDTTPPQLSPTFSSPPPFIVGTQGITVAPNASDAYGIASYSAGVVNTATVGQKSVTCSAIDIAGNTATVNVPYSVIASPATEYNIVSILPAYVIPHQISALPLPVLFQLRDANKRLLSDQAAASLLAGISITYDGVPVGQVQYHKQLNLFSATLKLGKQLKGMHELAIHVAVNGAEVATLKIPVKIV